MMAQTTQALATKVTGDSDGSSGLLASPWPSPSNHRHLQRESAEGRPSSRCLSAFQIKVFFF